MPRVYHPARFSGTGTRSRHSFEQGAAVVLRHDDLTQRLTGRGVHRPPTPEHVVVAPALGAAPPGRGILVDI